MISCFCCCCKKSKDNRAIANYDGNDDLDLGANDDKGEVE